MAGNEEITGFLKAGLERSLPREQLKGVLLEAGWPRDQVRRALDGFADVAFPIPVPRPAPYLSAREAFVYLVLFGTLYGSAISFGSLIFALIHQAFPDPSLTPAAAMEMAREEIRWSISFLVATFPVFAFVFWTNDRAVRKDPGRRLSRVRQSLTYLSLFVGAATLIGVVTSIVYNLLGGELTVRFALKVLTVGTITGSLFGYFLRDVRREEVAECTSRRDPSRWASRAPPLPRRWRSGSVSWDLPRRSASAGSTTGDSPACTQSRRPPISTGPATGGFRPLWTNWRPSPA